METLKNIFTKNLLLKVLSIIIAIIVWLLVVNIENPTMSRNFTSNVEVINADVLTAQGRYYVIPEGQNSVTFRVTAARNVIEKLSSSDFYAVADMNNLEDDSRIPINISARNYANSLDISTKLQYLRVEIGEEMSDKFIINPVITGEPASGFAVDEVEVTPNVVSVSGPDRIVNTIREVRAECGISNMNTDISESVVPVFLDGNGERVDTTKLDVSVSTVTVNVKLTNVKEVPITLEGYTPAVAAEKMIDSVSFTPDRVGIRGSSAILNDFTEIEIPASVVDINTITSDFTTTVDITRYLPEGVKLSEDSQAEVTLSITFYTEGEREVEIPTGNITARGLSNDERVVYTTAPISLTISGISSVIEELSPSDITGSIDVTGLGIGEHTVRFIPDEDSRYSVAPISIGINIVRSVSE